MTTVYDPIKCPDCDTWWRSETHRCLFTVTAAMVQPVIHEQLEINTLKGRKDSPNVRTAKSGRRWSAKDDELMLELFAKGVPCSQISKIMGRTQYAVWNRRSKVLAKVAQ